MAKRVRPCASERSLSRRRSAGARTRSGRPVSATSAVRSMTPPLPGLWRGAAGQRNRTSAPAGEAGDQLVADMGERRAEKAEHDVVHHIAEEGFNDLEGPVSERRADDEAPKRDPAM